VTVLPPDSFSPWLMMFVLAVVFIFEGTGLRLSNNSLCIHLMKRWLLIHTCTKWSGLQLCTWRSFSML
jgi:hypothetical protein